jgi:hypothetical protein
MGTLRRGVKQFGSGNREATPGKDLKSAQTQELERLRRELHQVKIERRRVSEGGSGVSLTPISLPLLLIFASYRPNPRVGGQLQQERLYAHCRPGFSPADLDTKIRTRSISS